MIAKMRLPAELAAVRGLNRSYEPDANGFIFNVETCDVGTLRQAGAEPVALPETLALKVRPQQILHFDSAQHIADADGLIRDVPHDTAKVLIANGTATEATAEDLARAGDLGTSDAVLTAGALAEISADELAAIRTMAAHADAIFAALSAKFDAAEIVDTGETVPPHGDMIFTAIKDGVELARGTVTELFAFTTPAAPTPQAPAAPSPAQNAPASDAAEHEAADAAPHDGDPLPETAPAAE